MVLTLFLVTLIASAALAAVYELTKEPIAAARLAKKMRAIEAVLPEFDNQPVEERYALPIPNSTDSLEFYPGKKGGELLGTAIRTKSSRGYSGDVWLMVGLKPDGAIQDVFVLEHRETPGLGSKMADEKFAGQFRGKHPAEFNLEVVKDGGDVDAISGATISSRAYGEAVQLAFDMYQKEGKK